MTFAMIMASCDSYAISDYFIDTTISPVEPDPVEPDPDEPDPVEPEPVEPDPVEEPVISFEKTSNTEALISWDHDDAPLLTGFRIERSATPSGQTATVALGPEVRKYSDSGVTPNTNYTYRLYALYGETEKLLGERTISFTPN